MLREGEMGGGEIRLEKGHDGAESAGASHGCSIRNKDLGIEAWRVEGIPYSKKFHIYRNFGIFGHIKSK